MQPWYLKIGLFLSFLKTSFIIWISLTYKNANFRDVSWKFVITIFVKMMFWLWTKLSSEEYIKIDTMSASDQISNMPFLRNEFSKIFQDLFTMTLFTKMTHIYDQTKNNKLKLKTWIWRWWYFEIWVPSDSLGVNISNFLLTDDLSVPDF